VTSSLLPVLDVAALARAQRGPTAADKVARGETVTVDAVVVGSGAGGAAAARGLARAGLQVLVLEEGRRYTEKDFQGKKLPWSLLNLWRDRGVQSFEGPVISLLPAGRVVGGSTVINSGICFRATPERLVEWRAHAPWMTDARMATLYDDVEKTIGVVETNPFIARKNNLTFLRGANALGLKHGFIRRNAPGCQGCGICHQGCPSGGKWSVDKNYLAQAEEAGASVLPAARVTTLRMEGRRCVGVDVDLLGPDDAVTGHATIHAKYTVLAAGSIGTALILQKNDVGTRSGHAGKNLAIHPAAVALAYFEEDIQAWSGVPQGAWAEVPETPEVLLETQGLSADVYYALLGKAGADGLAAMQRANKLCSSGGMIRDRSVGEIRAGGDWRARILYSLHEEDRQKLVLALRWLSKLKFAAGAVEVQPGVKGATLARTVDEALAQIPEDLPATRFLHMHASHPMGTARMTTDPAAGVVDPTGKVFDTTHLYVMDAAIFPSSLGVNPQMTIMAMASHLSELLASGKP